MNRLKDLRIKIRDMAEAKTAFGDLAQAELALAKADAQFEARIARQKKEHQEKTLDLMLMHQAVAEGLTVYIETHTDEFIDPRKIKTDMGTFGLQTVTEVEITDEPALMKCLIAERLEDCFKVSTRPVKSGIEAMLKNGRALPGCALKTGDTAVYKVSKVLLDEARTVEE